MKLDQLDIFFSSLIRKDRYPIVDLRSKTRWRIVHEDYSLEVVP